jgi:hypothetical protein
MHFIIVLLLIFLEPSIEFIGAVGREIYLWTVGILILKDLWDNFWFFVAVITFVWTWFF